MSLYYLQFADNVFLNLITWLFWQGGPSRRWVSWPNWFLARSGNFCL